MLTLLKSILAVQLLNVFIISSINCQDSLPGINPQIQIVKVPTDSLLFFKAASNIYNQLFYIPYRNRNALVALDAQGNILWNLLGVFENAIDITADEKQVYVLDEVTHEVIVFSIQEGKTNLHFGKELNEKLKEPVSIGLVGEEEIYIFDAGRIRLNLFNREGKFLRSRTFNGLVDPGYMLSDGKSLYAYDNKIKTLIKYDTTGKSYGKVQCDQSKPGDGKGNVFTTLVDGLGYVLVFNENKSIIEWYDWEEKPRKILEIPSIYNIQTVEHITWNPSNYYINYIHKDNLIQTSVQGKIPIPDLENNYSFSILGDKLTVTFQKLPAKLADRYGLFTKNDSGKDIMVSITRGEPFVIDPVPSEEIKNRKYHPIAFNASSQSNPTKGFDDYFGLGKQFKSAGLNEEALLAFQNALRLMRCEPALIKYIAHQIKEIGKDLVFNKKNILKGIQALLKANELEPADQEIKRILADGYLFMMNKLAEQENYTLLMDEVTKATADPYLKPICIQALDSLAVDLERLNTMHVLTHIRMMRLKLLDWTPTQLKNWESAFRVNNLLYHEKIKNGAPEYELQAFVSENERYIQKIMTMLQDESKPYYKEYIEYLKTLYLAKKYMELEAQAKKGLTLMANLFLDQQLFEIHSLLAESLIAQNKYEAAIQEYNLMVSLKPGETKYKLGLASALFINNNIPEALDLYKQLLLSDPENPDLLTKIGLSNLALSNFGEASNYLEKALKVDVTHKGLFGPIAEAYEGSGNFQSAIDYYKLAALYYNQINNNTSTWKNRDNLTQEKTYLEKLAKLYQQVGKQDQASEIYLQLTKANPKDAVAWFGLGNIHLSRGLIYEATNAFQIAMNIDPANLEYKVAFQNCIDLRNQAAKNNEPLTITGVTLNDIYPSLYINYSDVSILPIGEVTFTNSTPWPITVSSFTIEIKEFMNQPTGQKTNVIVGFSNQSLKLSAVFNNSILDVVQSQNVQVNISATYTYDNNTFTVSKITPLTIHARNAINWADKKRIASFIHVGAGNIADYVLSCMTAFKTAAIVSLPEPLTKAIQIYTVLNHSEIKYNQDPDLNFSSVSSNTNLIDFLQYPDETLIKKSGDCDDLVTLYCSALENAGISTAYIDIPGHIFMAFEVNLSANQIKEQGFDPEQLILSQGKVWLPIETTLIGEASFISAWQSAINRYKLEINKGNLPDLTPMSEARRKYKPSLFKLSEALGAPPVQPELISEYNEQVYSLFATINDGNLSSLKTQQVYEPNNVFLKNRYAILLAQSGRLIEAKTVLLEAHRLAPTNASLLNNLGNITLQEGNAEEAIIYFEQSHELNSESLPVILNLVKANIKAKNKEMALKWIELASSISGKASEYETYRILISQL